MDKHQFRILEHENMELRNQIFYLNKILDNVTEWLEQEVKDGQEVINEYEGKLRPKCTDGSDDIVVGRVECAESLLEQIKKWESEDE